MIIDEVTITVEAGTGGDGSASFRREKFVPKGGPDGGDGGKGGDVYLKANPAVHTLSRFLGQKYFKAQEGRPGGTNQKTGKSGDDLILEVPPGTIIYRTNNEESKLGDLVESGQTIKVAKGGRGGWGNIHFKTATHQAPTEFNEGQPGEKLALHLELKLIADVGLVGLPNAGKSTLLSRISKAEPKIADYPFTTLEPNLGVATYDDQSFIAADIPGLIEGAAQGKGLGHAFLRHIERTRLLVHILDITSEDPARDYKTIRQELSQYEIDLTKKPEIIVINKIDTLSPEDLKKKITKLQKKLPDKIFPISAVSGLGLDKLLAQIIKQLDKDDKN